MIASIANEPTGTEIVLACNICGSEQIQKVDPDFNLCCCNSCGYVFDSPRPSFEEISAFYSQAGKYDAWLKEERARDLLWKRRLKKLLQSGARGSLLDIGAGYGQFLHHAQPFFSTVAGTEVSASAIAVAREKYGLELLAGQVEELDLPQQSFDTITLFHVLEHVPDPGKLVALCHALLRPKGILAVAVPNDVLAWTSKIKKIGKQLGLKPFQKFSLKLGIARAGASREIHLSHFTPTVLRRLLENSGLHIMEESLDPFYVSRGIRLFLNSAYYAAHRALHSALRINRYDTIWMVARKP
ncbi:MAG TPA: class I SAM-dependent methyltransferase [Candidatus Angelobacter sp.]|jgi:SAM-dependent methyltransferase|nr:class I SAM-dependent methyltransferase [Candidatus Angelobacter sp.]